MAPVALVKTNKQVARKLIAVLSLALATAAVALAQQQAVVRGARQGAPLGQEAPESGPSATGVGFARRGLNSKAAAEVSIYPPVRPLLDALDTEHCGRTSSRPWHLEQSAFDCFSPEAEQRPAYEEPKQPILEPALQGEFPFYVQINQTSCSGEAANATCGPRCGAALVHSDLVITSAACIREFNFKSPIILGSQWLNGTGGEVTFGKRACAHKLWAKGSEFDLAIIRLAEPVEYVPGKIWPACVAPPSANEQTVCALATFGTDFPATKSTQPSNQLQSVPVRRFCSGESGCPSSSVETANYDVISNLPLALRWEEGAPIVCYDRCSSTDDRVQAYTVGIVYGDLGNFVFGTNVWPSYLEELVEMVRDEDGSQESENVMCASVRQGDLKLRWLSGSALL